MASSERSTFSIFLKEMSSVVTVSGVKEAGKDAVSSEEEGQIIDDDEEEEKKER